MFGYIRPKIPELKVREYDQYKGIYCSLCKRMGKEYGIASRFALSYDSTFLVLMMLGLEDECTPFQPGKCVFNPLKKCNYCTSGQVNFEFASALTVMMTYQKIRDDIEDSGFGGKLKAYLVLPLVAGANKKAAKKYPELKKILDETIATQSQVEKEENPCLDACAEPTAQMLARTFAMIRPTDERLTRVLQNFGYFLGKWVYTVDAADDIEKDIKENAFNPFIIKFGLSKESTQEEIKQVKTYCNESLNAVLSQEVGSYHLMEIHHFEPIIHNIIFEGLPQMQKELLFKKENHDVGSI